MKWKVALKLLKQKLITNKDSKTGIEWVNRKFFQEFAAWQTPFYMTQRARMKFIYKNEEK